MLAILFVPAISIVDEVNNINKIEYFPMKGVYIPSIFIVLIELGVLLYYMLKKKSKSNRDIDKTVIYTTIVVAILFFVFQGLFSYISVSPISFTFLLFLLYLITSSILSSLIPSNKTIE